MSNGTFHNIGYLEDSDFVGKKLVVPKKKNANSFVMIQASWCPACSASKGEFQQFADLAGDEIDVYTIQIDGDKPSQRALKENLQNIIPGIEGIPMFVLYDKDGNFVDSYEGERSVSGFSQYALRNDS